MNLFFPNRILGKRNLFYGLPDLDQLRRAGLRVRLQLPPFRPVIGVVMMADIAQEHAFRRPVNDEPDVAADTNGPEIRIPGLVQLMEPHARTGGIQLEVKGRRLDELLLFVVQLCEAVGKGVGDTEVHWFHLAFNDRIRNGTFLFCGGMLLLYPP